MHCMQPQADSRAGQYPRVAKKKSKPNEVLAERLREAMQRTPDLRTQVALARRTRLGQSTISRILRGEVDAQAGNVSRLAEALGISMAELYAEPSVGSDTGHRLPLPGSARSAAALGNSNLAAATHVGGVRVPLISRAQVRSYVSKKEQQRTAVDAEAWLLCPVKCGPRAFSMRNQGAAMETKFSHGDIIFVDPDVPAEAGRFVVVLPESGEPLLRELVIEGGRGYLKVLNEDWPGPRITPLEPGATIVGVAIGKWVDV